MSEPTFIDLATRQESTETELREAYPTTIWPAPFLPPEGWAAVLDDEPPTFDALTQRLVRQPAALRDEGWRHAWAVVELTADEQRAIRQALVPASVTRRQARQALLLAGLLDGVDAAIAAMPEETEEEQTAKRLAQIEWQDATDFDRHRPLVIQLGTALGLDADALDDMFIHAKTL